MSVLSVSIRSPCVLFTCLHNGFVDFFIDLNIHCGLAVYVSGVYWTWLGSKRPYTALLSIDIDDERHEH